jgi:ankyrin repeat protein
MAYHENDSEAQRRAFLNLAKDGDTKRMLSFLKSGVSVDATNQGKNTALMLTCHRKMQEPTQLLLEHKANLDMQDCNGWSALMFAADMDFVSGVDMLLQAKADVNLKSREGATALMYAALEDHVTVLKHLINAKADLMACDNLGKTAMDHAHSKNNIITANYLDEIVRRA